MNERSRILLINAISWIEEQSKYDPHEIATVLLGMTEEEWDEIKHEF